MAVTKRAAALGVRGEELAVRYVEQLGWRVLDRNWRCRAGEIDIVAADEATSTLVIVEVKCRSGKGYGHPLEAITHEKVARLLRLAAAWAREHRVRAREIRVDGIGLVLASDGGRELTHVRGLGSW